MEEKDDGSREVKTIFGAPIAIACCGDLSDAFLRCSQKTRKRSLNAPGFRAPRTQTVV